MKIVLAPDSYKGSLTAKQACDAMERGIVRAMPDAEIVKVPMADGGEGTIDSLADATGGRIVHCETTDPLGRPAMARYAILGDGETAAIEMAEASGLTLIEPDERNPIIASTYGTGLLIQDALDQGCRRFILGIGGSATNDGGAGMAVALGAKLLDADGCDLPAGGGALVRLAGIDLSGMDSRLSDCQFAVACDVDNPLCGESGASRVFGPQKGATPDTAQLLDRSLAHYADVVERDLGKQILQLPGGGAGGGMAAGAAAFLGARLEAGVELVKRAVRFDDRLTGADLVLTGEGRCDAQTVRGKTAYGVAIAAKQAGIPAIVVAGSVGNGVEALYEHGVHAVFSMIDRPMTMGEAVVEADHLLANAAERIVRLFKIAKEL